MKLSPTIEVPSWLYMQLMRYVEIDKINQIKQSNNKNIPAFFK